MIPGLTWTSSGSFRARASPIKKTVKKLFADEDARSRLFPSMASSSPLRRLASSRTCRWVFLPRSPAPATPTLSALSSARPPTSPRVRSPRSFQQPIRPQNELNREGNINHQVRKAFLNIVATVLPYRHIHARKLHQRYEVALHFNFFVASLGHWRFHFLPPIYVEKASK